METVTPKDVFGVGYYWYQFVVRSDRGVQKMVSMPKSWWHKWAVGLLRNVYPVMSEVLKPVYVDLWVDGLMETLTQNGLTVKEVIDIFKEASEKQKGTEHA